MRIPLCVALLILFLVPAAASRAIPDDKLIVPGQRIGKWTLNMSVDDLVKASGPGESGPLKDDDVQSGLVFRQWSLLGLTAVHRVSRARVEYLSLTLTAGADVETLRSFKTEKGIGIYAKNKRVIEAYGSPTGEILREVTARKRAIYDTLGIAFWLIPDRLAQDWDVTAVYLFRPGTAKTIWKF